MRQLLAVTSILVAASTALAAPREAAAPRPPKLAAQPVIETYHGTPGTDRYRFVEQMTPPTLAWMRAEAAYTRSALDSIAPRAALQQRMNALGGRFGFALQPQYGGARLFFLDRSPGVDQYSLAVREADGTKRLLEDVPAAIRAAGTPMAIDHFEPSRDGRFVALGMSAGGSESIMLTVIDTATGRTIAGPVRQGPFTSTSWDEDGVSLFFNRMPDPVTVPVADRYKNSEVLYWRIGQEPRIVVGAKQRLGPNRDPIRFPQIATPRGTDRALLLVANGVENEMEGWEARRADVAAGRATWRKVVETADAVTAMYATPQRLFLLTHRDAPTFKITSTGWNGTAAAAATVLPAAPDIFLEQVMGARDGAYVRGRQRLAGAVWRIGDDGRVTRLTLPVEGNVATLEAQSDREGAIIQMDSLASPSTTYAWDAGRWVDLGLETRPPLDMTRYLTMQLDAPAADGTAVPLVVLATAGPRRPQPFLLEA